MKEIKKAGGYNLLILILFSVGSKVVFPGKDESDVYSFLFFAASGVLIQTLINVGLSIYFFVKGKSGWGKAFIVSFVTVLIIGYSSCFVLVDMNKFFP